MSAERLRRESPLPNDARMTLSRMLRAEERAEKAIQVAEQRRADALREAQEARTDLARIHADTCQRFGVEWPMDALLLDVLQQVSVEPNEVWHWHGARNNKGLATLKTHGRERSVVRFLATHLGIIRDEDFGFLYPVNGDTDDINPRHRDVREPAVRIGNPDRYAVPSEASA